MNRKQAEDKLQRIFKLQSFYNEQWQAIEKLLEGERILMIEKKNGEKNGVNSDF